MSLTLLGALVVMKISACFSVVLALRLQEAFHVTKTTAKIKTDKHCNLSDTFVFVGQCDKITNEVFVHKFSPQREHGQQSTCVCHIICEENDSLEKTHDCIPA